MKVICIKQDSNIIAGPNKGKQTSFLKEAGIYTVIHSVEFKGDIFYQLSELGERELFWSMLFIPLSTIDEMELLHNRQTELA